MGSARESRGRPPFLLSRGAFFLIPTPRPSSRRPRGSTDPSSLSFSSHTRVYHSPCDSVDRLRPRYDHHGSFSSLTISSFLFSPPPSPSLPHFFFFFFNFYLRLFSTRHSIDKLLFLLLLILFLVLLLLLREDVHVIRVTIKHRFAG